MTNPDPRVHASETCMAVVTVLVIFALFAVTVLAVVEAYQ